MRTAAGLLFIPTFPELGRGMPTVCAGTILLGPDYEVVLHDLTSEEGTIAAIVNNNISGQIGRAHV